MKTLNCQASACRHCRFYTPVGRRGGNCQQLGVPVRGGWKACSLAVPPFAPSWEGIEEIMGLPQTVYGRGEALWLERAYQQPSAAIAPDNIHSAPTPSKSKTNSTSNGSVAYLS
ncbi:hypothetical protein [Phormidium sp. CCY1219]|uniref:hypothetical protein n=1 Tax=Phormidium sp. CCY1219 TaxID=2886104 RepID=UPI002D1F0B8E|nr:hypothetical protein [Phormidium sp. CCY1219]MEB3825900.1 hypothetical protein [Phormidium sp. CCY1219]